MPRIRTVKPEFWSSEQVAACSRDARLLFIGLWNFCDDAGRHPASSIRLKMEVFPGDNLTDEEVKQLIKELQDNGLIYEYSDDRKHYWQVTGWHHQKIDKPNHKYPPPNNNQFDDHSTTTPRIVDDHSPTTPRPSTRGKGKGKGKGDICEVDQTTSPLPLENKDVEEVFNHWKTKLNHPKAKLDEKRKRKIQFALKLGYSVGELKLAIDGCKLSDFHMGKNDSHTAYDSIDLILRDSDHIDKFITMAKQSNNRKSCVQYLDGSY